MPAAENVPGARWKGVSWAARDGSLWLFGGDSWDSTGTLWDRINDLWHFNPTTEEWTWVDGANIVVQKGTYGTEDVPAAENVPGARTSMVSWVGKDGSLWLFGGLGYDSAGIIADLNDLWKYPGPPPAAEYPVYLPIVIR